MLPAGTRHQCRSADADFPIIGTYRFPGTYNECIAIKGRPPIPKVPVPRNDGGDDGAGGRDGRPELRAPRPVLPERSDAVMRKFLSSRHADQQPPSREYPRPPIEPSARSGKLSGGHYPVRRSANNSASACSRDVHRPCGFAGLLPNPPSHAPSVVFGQSRSGSTSSNGRRVVGIERWRTAVTLATELTRPLWLDKSSVDTKGWLTKIGVPTSRPATIGSSWRHAGFC